MVTQKPISLKIDHSILEQLDIEAARSWKSRNKLINEAVHVYLQLLYVQRQQRHEESRNNPVSKDALQFIKKYLIRNVQYFLDVIDHH